MNNSCQRCGNKELSYYPCANCQKNCLYCRRCIMMGRVSECARFVYWTGPVEKQVTTPTLNWSGVLSEAQAQAADRVIEAITHHNELLIWAVCGSGKTEILFPGIYFALQQQKNICIATPRTDVVHELTPRLKAAFPDTSIASLYGGSSDRLKNAEIAIATTHQLLRYKNWFDVIIIDEVDAFPYATDEMLQYAVQTAKAPNAATIYLSATPNRTWQKSIPTALIPARYHRHPLPVPKFRWCGNWKRKLSRKQLPAPIMTWVSQQLDSQKQAFLFVPHIETAKMVKDLLKLPAIDSVHAEDKSRKEKVERFRNGEIPILITTTILERGVTVPNIDVAVFGADAPIFTESALIQIAGRVGRSARFPTGDVIFFHFGKTKAMLSAKHQIEQMNEEAKKRGMLH